MPKAKGKGGKNRRRGKNEGDEDKRELVFKEDGQEYAQVVKMLGNGRLEAKCQDGETRLGQIRGQMRKKVWIVAGDIILLSLRDFQDDKADVIHRYTPDEARNLKTYGELKSDFQINEGGDEGGMSDEEGGVEFEEAEIDDICELNLGMALWLTISFTEMLSVLILVLPHALCLYAACVSRSYRQVTYSLHLFTTFLTFLNYGIDLIWYLTIIEP